MKTYSRVKELLQSDIDSGMSLRAVCRKADLHPNTIGSYLEGRAEVSQASLEKIASAYHTNVAWLRGDSDNAAASTSGATCDAILDISSLSPEEREMWARCCRLPEAQRKIIGDVVESLLKAF